MPQSDDEVKIVSEEFGDILSKAPHWILRWGSLSILTIIVFFVVISSFVKYPTVVNGNLKLTTQNIPVKVVSKSGGKLDELFFKEADDVRAGDKLALVETTIPEKSVDCLRAAIPKIHAFVEDRVKVINLNPDLAFGDLQGEYNELVKSVSLYRQLLTTAYYSSKITNLKEQIGHRKQLESIAHNQRVLIEKEVRNASRKYDTDKKLAEAGVMASVEFLEEENVFIKQQAELENSKKYEEEIRISVLEYENQLNTLTFEFREKERVYKETIQQSLKSLESSIDGWRQNYVIEAPIAGKVYLSRKISEKQFINAGDAIFTIVPSDEKYICEVNVPAYGFGKVKQGQRVRVKLDGYPYNEFGQLMGIVEQVPEIPYEEQDNASIHYRVLVNLTSFKTSYNRELTLKPEMTGVGEILTDELTLLQRIIYHVRAGFDKIDE